MAALLIGWILIKEQKGPSLPCNQQRVIEKCISSDEGVMIVIKPGCRLLPPGRLNIYWGLPLLPQ